MASKFHAARSSRLWLEACLSAWMRTFQAVLVSEGRPFKGSFGDPNSWQMNNLHEGNWLLRLVRLAPKLFGDFTLEQGVNSYYCGWTRCARLVCTFSYCNLWIPTIIPLRDMATFDFAGQHFSYSQGDSSVKPYFFECGWIVATFVTSPQMVV